LKLKLKIYANNFAVTSTLPSPDKLISIGNSSRVTFNIAQQAASLISPSRDELNIAIPSPPSRDDSIVFVSDIRAFQQCSTCRQTNTLEVDALQNSVIRLYSGSGQVIPSNLTSYTFQDLADMLNAGTGQLQIENDLKAADWIVFAMDTVSSNIPVSLALRQFLDLRPDLIQGKHLIVFSLSEPYALDATDISKLSAYYALYSRSSPFIEIAARILFHEIQPVGHLPVSVPGIGYEILEVTSPDPNQVIQIYQDIQGTVPSEGTQTPSPAAVAYKIGDPISIVSGVILDHNGNLVPDGTVVRFTLYHEGDNVPAQIVEAQTTQGIARGKLIIDQSGEISVRAESGAATNSIVLIFEIPPESLTGTPPPASETTEPTFTPTLTATVTPTPTPQSTPTPVNITDQGNVNFGDWVVALFVAVIVSGANYWLTNMRNGLRWGVRAALLPMIGGMFTYVYLAINLPGSGSLLQRMGTWAVLLLVLIGSALGAGAVWVWQRLDLRNVKPA
jgi:beta-N-acetylhexosaminidase